MESARVGLIVDSSALIDAERKGEAILVALERMSRVCGDAELALSVVSVAELTHGVYRARTEADRQKRSNYLDGLCHSLPVFPLTTEIARLAGMLQAQRAAQGIAIPFEDLVIGATALHIGYGVLTNNTRHFRLIPGLNVVEL